MNLRQLEPASSDIFSEHNFLEQAAALLDENVTILDCPTGKEMHGVNGYIQYLASFVNLIPDLKSRVIEFQAHHDKVMSRLQMQGNFTGTLQTAEGICFGNGNPIDIEYQIEQEFNADGKVGRLVFNYDLPEFLDQLSRRRYRVSSGLPPIS